jgi:hypothetical protein
MDCNQLAAAKSISAGRMLKCNFSLKGLAKMKKRRYNSVSLGA